jgi:hypothetical protein
VGSSDETLVPMPISDSLRLFHPKSWKDQMWKIGLPRDGFGFIKGKP